MNMRFRLALLASLTALTAIALLVIVSGFVLQRSLLRDLDEELRVQANVILQDVITDDSLTQETETALTTTSGSSTAWIYRIQKTGDKFKLDDGRGTFNAPEPLDETFFKTSLKRSANTVAGWRVVSVRQDNVLIQVGRSMDVINRVLQNYVRAASLLGLLAALFAGGITTWIVGRTTAPLEQLAKRVRNLESSEPLPALNNQDEVGALARALSGSLKNLQDTRARESRFLADAAHELRTPIAAIMADLGHHRSRNRTTDEDLAAIDRAQNWAGHLRELTNNLLMLTQTAREQGEQHSQHQRINLFELTADVVDKFMILASSKKLEMRFDGEPVFVRGDPLMLERVITNILGNAIKYTDNGEILVSLKKQNAEAQLHIQDTGIGMSEQTLERVFEPFERGVQNREGSGLGLAVVKSVVEIHAGRVKIKSQYGVGSTVMVALPEIS